MSQSVITFDIRSFSVRIEKFVEPLEELVIVLEFCFYHPLNLNRLEDIAARIYRNTTLSTPISFHATPKIFQLLM